MKNKFQGTTSRTQIFRINNAMNKFYNIGLLLLLMPVICLCQNLIPAGPQTKRILLLGGTVHVGDGTVINNGAVGFEKGKLSLVADATLIRIDRSAYDTIIDIQGKHVYPGLIAMDTNIGINEIAAVRATNDVNEVGSLNPSVRSIIAYNTDSKVIPTVRSNGILLAQVVPGGGLVSGQSSVVQLDAWNYEDAAYKIDEGVHVRWPSMRIPKSKKDDADEKQQQKADRDIEQIRKLFSDAKAYSEIESHPEKNTHLESLKGLFNGSQSLYVHCNLAKEIIAASGMCAELGMKMVLVGGIDALQVKDLLKSQNIPVVLNETHRLPSRDDEAVDLPFTRPSMLRDAGIEFAISIDDFWQVRNLPFQAGTAGGNGLTREQMLQSVCATPAKILGIYNLTGSVEQGKDATLIISTGDLFDMKTSKVESAFINGRQIDLDNIQSQLNRKYRTKYGLDQ